MTGYSTIKAKLRYHRLVVISIVLCYIWVQYEFSSGNWSYGNGQPRIVGKHVNGKDEGTWTWFYENGNKQMQGNFSGGKRDGVWTIWDASGSKLSESNYKNDRLEGPMLQWYGNGKLKTQSIYHDDKLVSSVSYDADGKPLPGQ